MKSAQAIAHCNAWLAAHPEEAAALHEIVRNKQAEQDILINGKPFPSTLRPAFIDGEQRAMLRRSAELLVASAERVLRAYPTDLRIQEALGPLREGESECLLHPSGLERQLLITRPDGFLVGDQMMYLEINADSPAALAWTDLQAEIFGELPYVAELEGVRPDGGSGGRAALLRTLQAAADDFGIDAPLRVAIVDWAEVGTRLEFQVVKRYLESQGVRAVVTDPRALELRGDSLYAEGEVINVVYRRVIAGELLARQKEGGVRDLLAAYRRGLVCMVNPLCAKLAGRKSLFAVLTDEHYADLFTAEQRESNARHLPFTRLADPGPVIFGGEEHELFELLRAQREAFIIKPTTGYGGQGVSIGCETEPGQWDALLERAAAEPGEWTAQELIVIPERPYPIFDQALTFEQLKVNINPFVLGGVFAGSMVRISRNSVVNASLGGGFAPVFVLP